MAGAHESASKGTDTWITPKYIIDALGPFDLDPCTPAKMPWPTARIRYTQAEDGLKQLWFGRVWLNPPYSDMEKWLRRMVNHENGIGIWFARTETEWFFKYIWEKADSIFFFRKRIRFYNEFGYRGESNSTAPSVLVAYGENNVEALHDSKLDGKHQMINRVPIIVVGITPQWLGIIEIAVRHAGSDKELKPIYDLVERIAPDKCQKNPNWKAKVRQQIQVIRKKYVA